MRIEKQVAPAFENILFDWDYEKYLVIGGYGSGKSYNIAFKILLKLLAEKRKALIFREVFETLYESCYDLICEILEDMGLLTYDKAEYKKSKYKVLARKAPLSFLFHNGSRIIFKGLDKPEKVKSINGVSIVWIEECSEIKYSAYKELLGRIRTPDDTMHFILSCNPVGRDNWVYKHFFKYQNEESKDVIVMDEDKFYAKKEVVANGVYYHHSIPEDNPWLPLKYIQRLDELRDYDKHLWTIARHGMFGAPGIRVLPQIEIAHDPELFKSQIDELGIENQYFGFDFGFEESYNAVISCSVDIPNRILYIYDEIYLNHITDDLFALNEKMLKLKHKLEHFLELGVEKYISADSEDPKAIQYYRQQGYKIRSCKNRYKYSRIANTKKIKRFKRIIISPKCKNTINELRDLTYKRLSNGDLKYDEFNIDPHTFSAIWYALDTVIVSDLKERKFNSKTGNWLNNNPAMLLNRQHNKHMVM